MSGTRYALLGLGEAGRAFASALASSAEVAGWDPVASQVIDGVRQPGSADGALRGVDAVLAFTTAAHSADALTTAIAAAPAGALYADFATAGAGEKRALARRAEASGLRFVDAAIMAPVRRGAASAPVLLAGEGAEDLGAALAGDGLKVEVLDGPAGSAAARKLLRSMLVKGLTGVLVEALRAAEREQLLDWFADHAVETLTALEPATLAGFLDGTLQHSTRRIEEMTAAAAMVEADGGDAGITRAVAALLTSIDAEGIPTSGALR